MSGKVAECEAVVQHCAYVEPSCLDTFALGWFLVYPVEEEGVSLLLRECLTLFEDSEAYVIGVQVLNVVDCLLNGLT